MFTVTWHPGLSVGNDRLDNHHRHLIALVNQLGAAIGTAAAREVTGQVLGELIRYVYYHFGEEERLMEAAGYHDQEAHRRSHRLMAEHIRRLERTYDRDPDAVAAAELHVFLCERLVRHIHDEDSLLAPCLCPPARMVRAAARAQANSATIGA